MGSASVSYAHPDPCKDLAACDSDSDNDEGESSVETVSKRLWHPTISMSGSLAAALLFIPPGSSPMCQFPSPTL